MLLGPARRLVEELRGRRVRRALDVGCGVGSLLPDVREAFPLATVVGVDRSEGMLALAPRTARLAVMDASRLAVASESVDLVLLAFVLFHVPEPRRGLEEARRVLRPGGAAGAVTWGSELVSRATRVWDEALEAHGAPPLDFDSEVAQHELVDTPQKLERLFRAAGFVDIRVWAEDHGEVIGLERLVRLRTRLGRNRRRYESLDAGARAAFLADVRRRLAGLADEDFAASGRFVYAIAAAPRSSA